MNARLTPHIGSTFAQRAILRYKMEQCELEAERARFERIHADLQVDALLGRASQPEAANFCADTYEEVPDLVWLERLAFSVFLGAVLWVVGMWVTP